MNNDRWMYITLSLIPHSASNISTSELTQPLVYVQLVSKSSAYRMRVQSDLQLSLVNLMQVCTLAVHNLKRHFHLLISVMVTGVCVFPLSEVAYTRRLRSRKRELSHFLGS
jgi:hypothetical protein